MTLTKPIFRVALAMSALLLPGFGSTGNGLEKLCAAFSGFDQNGDGQIEIESLKPLAQAGSAGPRVLMLVEARLLEPLAEGKNLHPYLDRWVADLAKEDCRAGVVAVSLAKSPRHQDGRYVLALREFLKAIHAQAPLEGVVLVGHFPDASVVRTINWRRQGDVTLRKKTERAQAYKGVRFLRRTPEPVAPKADIVLADLDGRWEDIYIPGKTELPSTVAIFEDSIPPGGGPCLDMERKTLAFEDFFHVADGALEIREQTDEPGGKSRAFVALDGSVLNLECSPEDAKLPNGLAIPDILVSRIDARGIALNPRADVTGERGATLLDKAGRPREVTFPSKEKVPDWRNGIWEADGRLERKLLAEYFDRNHAYRRGRAAIAWRPSSIAYELRSGYRVMLQASKEWDASNPSLRDIQGKATLVDFAKWMEYPSVLRTVRAHSEPLGSRFHKTDYRKIEEQIGGPAWSWTRRGNKLVPSLQASSGGGNLNWFLLRTLYENGKVAKEPCFYHHIGCNAITPPGAAKYAYDHSRYGRGQGAEALLFYGNGLALVGRAKTYYDEPRGFTNELEQGQTFGRAWAKYFEIESRKVTGGDISRKKAYYWSVLGDWTLKLSKKG